MLGSHRIRNTFLFNVEEQMSILTIIETLKHTRYKATTCTQTFYFGCVKSTNLFTKTKKISYTYSTFCFDHIKNINFFIKPWPG